MGSGEEVLDPATEAKKGKVESSKSSEPGGTKKKKKSKSKERKKKPHSDVEWEKETGREGFSSDENWSTKEKDLTSPSTWDPREFTEQTGNMDTWKESNVPNRVQDLPSPALADPSEENRRSNGQKGESSDIDSMGSPSPERRRAKKSDVVKDKFKPGGSTDQAPSRVRHSVSADDDEVDDDMDRSGSTPMEAWRMRESWKSSSHTQSSGDSMDSGSRNLEPSLPMRGRGGRPEDVDNADQPPSKPQSHLTDDEEDEIYDDEKIPVSDDEEEPRKSKGKGKSSKIEDDESDELGKGSFHKLAKDFDKVKASSGSRKLKPSGGSNSGRRRRIKDREMDYSGRSMDSNDAEEFGEEEVRLRDDESAPSSSGGSASRRMRRATNRGGEDNEQLRAPGSGGRRPPMARRMQMRRASSERWTRAVEDSGTDADAIQRRARSTLVEANVELSRSAHGIRRYNSGGIGRMAGGMERSTYHGSRTPTDVGGRRTLRKAMRTPDSADSAGSFGEDYDYDMNLSGRSARTLDSIEDLEDFEHIDFQTPGMMDYDEEIYELMQRANPEHTAQLNRRVHRKREAVDYDQNMPMMTSQALMTRTASSQVQRQYVDQSNIDRRRLLLRSDSMSSTDELSLSNHGQPLRRTPGRRPPPRTRSSGMAAMGREVPGFMNQPPRQTDPENRRGVFRNRSTTTTHSFKQYQNKPNRVASLSRHGPRGSGDPIDPNSLRGATVHGEPSRGVRRHHSTAAQLQRPKSTTPTKPQRRKQKSMERQIPPKREESPELVSDDEEFSARKMKPVPDDDEDSIVSMENDVDSDPEPIRKKPTKKPERAKSVPVPASPKKKPRSKRDFTYKGNRRILHSLLYEAKMGVDMKDLFKQVQKGEIPKSPIKSLMMPSP